MIFTISSWEEYVNDFLKPMIKKMDEETFRRFLMRSTNGEDLEYQTMDALERVLNVVKDDEDFVEKEIIVLREMERSKNYEFNFKEE